MMTLKVAVTALAGLAQSASDGNFARWEPYIIEASARFGVPREWIRHVIKAESSGLTKFNGLPITSRAGAMGLMQLMPGTWTDMRLQVGLGPDPFDPHDNVLAGTAYLRAMYNRFGYPGLFAAYNAGPKRYAQHLATGARLPAETLAYVKATSETDGIPINSGSPKQSASLGVLVALANPQQITPAEEEKRISRIFAIRR